jgi:hypothetical protein
MKLKYILYCLIALALGFAPYLLVETDTILKIVFIFFFGCYTQFAYFSFRRADDSQEKLFMLAFVCSVAGSILGSKIVEEKTYFPLVIYVGQISGCICMLMIQLLIEFFESVSQHWREPST